MKDFIISFLDNKKIDWIEKDGKIIISQEFQKDIYYPEIDMYGPYILTEWNYNSSLNKELSSFNKKLEEKFHTYFECEYPGTFSVII